MEADAPLPGDDCMKAGRRPDNRC